MELVEEPSVLRKFIRLLQEPFTRIKERWLNYFAHLPTDDDPSSTSLDIESQSNQDPVLEVKRRDDTEDDGNDQRKRKSSAENQILSRGFSSRAPVEQDSQEGSTREEVLKEELYKEEILKERDVRNQPNENQTRRKMESHADVNVPPPGRPKLASRTTMTAIGVTVGLGHLWRFPNKVYTMEQTGNFVIIYSVLTLIFGFPLYFASLATGQYSSQAVLKVFGRVPLTQGVGLSLLLVSYVAAVNQIQMTGIGIHYFLSSFQFDLPWAKCPENGTFGSLCFEPDDETSTAKVRGCAAEIVSRWNELCDVIGVEYMVDFAEACCDELNSSDKGSDFYRCEGYLYQKYCPPLYPPALHFWNRTVLREYKWQDPPYPVLFSLSLRAVLCLLGGCALVYGIVLIGLRRTFYISMFLIPLMFAAFILFVVSTIRKNGSFDVLLKLTKLDLYSLQNADVWYTALEQSLYSLGLGTGLAISIGSISPFNNACHKTALAVTFSVLTANLLSATVVYAISAGATLEWNIPFHIVFDAGIGTAIVVYCQALLQLPVSWLFSCIFFALFTISAAFSASGLMSTICISISEIVRLSARDMHVINFIFVFSCFFLGIFQIMRSHFDLVETLSSVTISFSTPAMVAFKIFALFIYGFSFLCEDIAFMLGFYPVRWLLPVCLSFPISMVTALFFKLVSYELPHWPLWVHSIGVGAVIFILAPTLLVPAFRMFIPSRRSFLQIPNAGPKAEQHKLERKEFRWKKTKFNYNFY